MDEPLHVPVLLSEVLGALQPQRGGLYVDCTLGLGGHTHALLDAGATRVIGLDRDRSALAVATTRLAAFGERVEFVHADYRQLPAVLDATRRRAGAGGAGGPRRVVDAV